jgi:hypothetical protein
MKKFMKPDLLYGMFLAVFLGTVFFLMSSCGDTSDGKRKEPPPDTTAPWGNIQPVNGSKIPELYRIRISFDETMNTAVLNLSGTMTGSAFSPTWSSGSLTNNFLVISPISTWATGNAETITIHAEDLAGNPWQQTLTYQIVTFSEYGATVEVCDGQDNDGDGQIDEGGVCVGHIPTPEICDGCDNDLDGFADNPPPGGFPCGCTAPQAVPVGGCVSGCGCNYSLSGNFWLFGARFP